MSQFTAMDRAMRTAAELAAAVAKAEVKRKDMPKERDLRRLRRWMGYEATAKVGEVLKQGWTVAEIRAASQEAPDRFVFLAGRHRRSEGEIHVRREA